MKTENLADEIRQPANQIAITRRLSDYAKMLRGNGKESNLCPEARAWHHGHRNAKAAEGCPTPGRFAR